MRDNFDRQFGRTRAGGIGLAIIGILLQIAFYGAIIWATVKLVLGMTA